MKTITRPLLLLLLALGAPALAQETPLRSGDTVAIRITGVPAEEMAVVNGAYPIADSGSIRLPHIGDLPAAGLKPSALAARIEATYKSAEIYTRPIINVVTGETGARRVTFGGELKSAQPVAYIDGMTLVEGIYSCGGYTEFAKKIAMIRRDGKITTYEMKDIEKQKIKDPPLEPGDVVTIR